MKMAYYVTGEKRKALVNAVSEITGFAPIYKGVPSFAYQVGEYNIDKEGNLTGRGSIADDDISLRGEHAKLLRMLEERGFCGDVAEFGDEVSVERDATDAEPAERDALVIDIPKEGYSDAAIDNLEKLIGSKATLIKKVLGVESLTIEKTEDKLRFPWFTTGGYDDEVTAYLHFIGALCRVAKGQKRVTGKDKPTDNEKYAMRCFLLKLGFIGDEYKAARKVLLRNLEGSAAFRDGVKRDSN